MRGRPKISKKLEAILLSCPSIEFVKLRLKRNGYIVCKLGEGLFRAAYKVTKGTKTLVVKYSRSSVRHGKWGNGSPEISKAPTLVCGKYLVQHYYSPLSKKAFDFVEKLDTEMHPANCGHDTDGTIVAFDW